jgi:hypothetical protein
VANTILQVLTSNTFDQWRIVTNTLVNAANELRNNTYLKDSGGMSLANGSITVTQGNIQIVNGSLQLDKTSGESLYIASDGRLIGTLTVGNVSSTGNITTTGTINAVNRLFVGGVNVQSTLAGAFQQANTAYNQANTAYNQANAAFGQANAAYAQANTANSIAISAYGQANVAFSLGGVVFNQANTAYSQANVARNQANTAYNQANTAYGQANAAYSQANSGFTLGGVVFNQANTAYGQANAAYSQANAAFAAANNAANTVRITANSGVAQSAVSLNFINTASVLVSVVGGSAGNANVAFSAVAGSTSIAGILQLTDSVTSTSTTTAATPNSVKSAFDQATLGYGQANTAYNQANVARNQANTAYNTANNAANTVRVTANSGVAQSAVSLNFINTASVLVSVGAGSAGTANIGLAAVQGTTSIAGILQLTDSVTSTSTTTAATPNSVKSAFDQGNSAYGQANSAYGQANTAFALGGVVFNQANTANSTAISAYGQANTAYNQANVARNQANTAYNTANSAANTVRVTANSGVAQSAVSLNFVNTANIIVTVGAGASGSANVSFDIPTTFPSLSVGTLRVATLVANSVDAPAVSDSSSYRLRANQVTRGDGSFGVNQGGANGNAEIRFVSSSGVWQLTSNNISGLYYNILSSQNISDSVTTTSSSSVASSTAAKTAYDQAIVAYAQANGAFSRANSAANSVRVTANSGPASSNVSLNFVNTSSVLVSVTPGAAGIADISFSAVGDGTGTVQNISTGIGLTTASGNPITTTGTISANIASTTVQGITKLVNSVASTDAANAATASAVKTAYDQATTAYGQANAAYNQANVATNRTQVSANSGSIRSNVAVNFVNTSTVIVSVGSGSAGNADVAFSVNPVFTNGVNIGREALPTYKFNLDFVGDAAGTWRKIISTSLTNIPYSTVGFRIRIADPKGNHAVPASVDNMVFQTYLVACVRTEATNIGEPDSCYVRGPSNVIRAVKTAVGSYEIQVQNTQLNQEYYIEVDCYAINGSHVVSYLDGLSAGATDANTANVFSASVGSSTQYFERIEAKNRIVVTADSAAGNTDTLISPASIALRGNVTNGNPNSFINMYASPTFGQSVLELGSSISNYIDFKTPYTDDFDHRILADSSGLSIYAGSSTTSPNVLNILSGNVNIDSGTFFVDYLANEVGVGTTNPTEKLQVVGNILANGNITAFSSVPIISIGSTSNISVLEIKTNTGTTDNNIWHFRTVDSSGKLRLQAMTDALAGGGSLLEFNRNAQQITGIVLATSSSNDSFRITQTGSGNAFVVEDESNPDSTPFVIDGNGSVGVGGAVVPSTKLSLQVTSSAVSQNTGINSTLVDTSTSGSNNKIGVAGQVLVRGTADHFATGVLGLVSHEASTTITQVKGVASFIQVAAPGGGTINDAFQFIAQNAALGTGGANTIVRQHGFYAADLTSGGSNYGFFSSLTAGANKWGIYSSGTANNYFNGSVGIGVTTPTSKLHVVGDGNITTSLTVSGLNVTPTIIAAYSQANLAYTQANTANSIAISAYGQANAAFAAANNAANTVRVTANSGSAQSAVSLNFVNTATVTVSVGSGGAGVSNVSFSTAAAGTVQNINTGAGLTGGPISVTGTVSANIASTTVQGVTKLIDSVASNDTANAATGAAVKSAFDQATTAYGQANLAYARANTAADQSNAARVYANSGSMQSNVSLNFVNTSTAVVSVTPGSAGNANISFTIVPRFTTEVNTTAGITSVGSMFTGTSIGNATLSGSGLTLQGNTANITNATVVLAASPDTAGLAYLEMGGSAGGYIDFKAPYSDDYDHRIFSSASGLTIYAGSTTAALNVLSIVSGNVDIDSGALFVDSVTNRVGMGTVTPTTTLDVVGSASITYTGTGDALRITQSGTGNAFVVYDIANDITPFIIDDNGVAVFNHNQAVNVLGNVIPGVQLHANANPQRARISATTWGLSGGPYLDLTKSANSNVGSHGLVSTNEELGAIRFGASNGTQWLLSSRISSEMDGTPTAAFMPGRIVFETNSGAGTTLTERMRINSNGFVGIGNTAPNHTLSVSGNVWCSGQISTTGTLAADTISVSGTSYMSGTIIGAPILSVSSSASYAANAAGKTIVVDSASPVTLTFAASSLFSGFIIDIIRKGTGNVTIANTSTIAKLNVASAQPMSNISSRYATARVTYTATNEFILTGSITP